MNGPIRLASKQERICLERIPKSSTGTIACEQGILGNFDAFSEWKFHVSTQNMIAGIRKFEGRRQENPI